MQNGTHPHPPKVTQIWVQGLRTLERLRLDLKGLTVLIGDNGSGKSSLLEACELLHQAARFDFLARINEIHGGLGELLRFGTQKLTLGARIEAEGQVPLEYEFTLTKSQRQLIVESEFLHQVPPNQAKIPLLTRTLDSLHMSNGFHVLHATEEELLVPLYGRLGEAYSQCVVAALEGIEVHLPFEVMSSWGARAFQRTSALRRSPKEESTKRLDRLGRNLASAFSSLRSDFPESHWRETLVYVRLGLGDNIESVDTATDPSDGSLSLRVKYAALPTPVSAAQLSDGTLAYLAFVALYRLGKSRSLLCFDEPELHLHPHLLMRVLDFFESMAIDHPVLLATHSDRLLDGLTDPAESTVLCELDETRATQLVRPDKEALELWLQRYRGLGDLRASGHDASVMTRYL